MQLGLCGHPHGLSPEDIKNLWTQADTDRNGVVDFEEFQVLNIRHRSVKLFNYASSPCLT